MRIRHRERKAGNYPSKPLTNFPTSGIIYVYQVSTKTRLLDIIKEFEPTMDHENTAIVVSTARIADDDNTNLSDYAEQVELPEYAAPAQLTYNFPLVQYGKKVTVVSTRKPTTYTGFLIAVEQDPTLDGIFEEQGVNEVRIRHLNGTEDSYWQFDTIICYLLCTAVPTFYGPDSWQQTGVAYVWNEHQNAYTHGSQLQCMIFLKGLLDIGYNQPLVLTLSRTVTEHFMSKVMRRHEAMIAAVKNALKKQNKPNNLSFYAYWMEIIKSAEEVTLKNGGTYHPPALSMPLPLTVGFLKQHQTPRSHLEVIESYLPILPEWAQAARARP